MKLHFEPDLDNPFPAVEAVCDLFRRQEICRTDSRCSGRPGTT